MTVSEDMEYVTQGKVTGDVTITGGDSRPEVSVMDTAEHSSTSEHGIIYADGNHKVSISNLGTLNVKSANENDSVEALAVWSGASININNVDTVNIGTADEEFKTNYYTIRGWGANMDMTGVGAVNIFSAGYGICIQHGINSDGTFKIDASGDVHIKTGGTAIQSASLDTLGDNKLNAQVSIQTAGKVTVESTGGSAIQSFDQSGNWNGNGKTQITISGDEGVDILSPEDSIAIYMTRVNDNTSSLQIESSKGDVNITGENGIQTKLTNGSLTGTITGQNVTISSPVASAISMGANSDLKLAVNQDGGQITLTTDNPQDNAISVSDDSSSLILGDGKHTTDVNINGYVNLVDSNDDATSGKLTFADKTTTHVDGKYLANTEKAFITAGTNDNSVSFEGNSKLVIDHAQTGELNFSNNEAIRQAAADNIVTDNLLQNVTFDKETHQLTVGTVDKATAAERLGGSALTNVALAATEKNMDSVTALITNNASDTDAVKAALNSAAGFSGLANVAHGTYTMNGLFSDAVSGHLMNRQDQDVWAYGFHSKENVNGLSFGGDYDAQYNGVTAGVDLYKNGGTTAGVALTYGDSNVSGSNGFATTKSDSDYYGASIYGRFDRGSYALLGDISYMKGDHDVTQVNSGEIITASPDSDSISVGVKALKDYAAGDNGVLTPYVGLRYLRLSTDDFTASNGLHYVGDDQDMVIVPVGVNYTASISHGKWSVRPYAGIGYVWTAGDRSADQTVVVPEGADSFSYDTADSSSFIARVGVTTDCDDMSYGIGYSWQKGDSVSNNAWTLSASFRF